MQEALLREGAARRLAASTFGHVHGDEDDCADPSSLDEVGRARVFPHDHGEGTLNR